MGDMTMTETLIVISLMIFGAVMSLIEQKEIDRKRARKGSK